MRTVPFYSSINESSVGAFIEKVEEVKLTGEKDLFMKASSGGGNPFAGWGLITVARDWVAEVEGGTFKFRAEGVAASMMAYVGLFASNSESIQQTHFMVHRAAVPEWMESEETLLLLEKVNGDLMKAFKAKVDTKKFLALPQAKGVTSIKRFFDSRQPRIDVNLTAKEAKEIGLIQNVITLSPIEAQELNTQLIAAKMEPIEVSSPKPKTDTEIPKKTDTKMNVSELRTNHPEVYQEVLRLGNTEGTNTERDRVEAWMAYHEIDAEAVVTGIQSGEPVTQKAMAHFQVAGMKSGFVTNASASGKPINTKDTKTPDNLGGNNNKGTGGKTPANDPEANENLAAFDVELKKELGLKVEPVTAE